MIGGMGEPRWLDDTQEHAWRALCVPTRRGLPQLEKTSRNHEMLMVHYYILAALSEAPDNERRLSDLADLSNTSPSRLSHRIRPLLARGDIETRTSPDDRRVTYAKLTRTGRKRLETIAPQHANDVHKLIFDHLTPDQTIALADALAAIAATLCNHDHFRPPTNATPNDDRPSRP